MLSFYSAFVIYNCNHEGLNDFVKCEASAEHYAKEMNAQLKKMIEDLEQIHDAYYEL